jgi:phage shock protein PspC (stress-responsive transcriptional regulator)
MMSLMPSPDYFRNNVALRNDTILGVCEALGHDLGFNPMFLRVPLAAGIIFAPVAMVAIYLGLGILAFASRTFFPDRVLEPEVVAEEVTAPVAHNQQMELPRAA